MKKRATILQARAHFDKRLSFRAMDFVYLNATLCSAVTSPRHRYPSLCS